MQINTTNMQQVTCETDTNWNIYCDSRRVMYAVAVRDGCKDSYFGDIKHIIGLIYDYNSFKESDFTIYGMSLIDGYLEKHGYKHSDLFKN